MAKDHYSYPTYDIHGHRIRMLCIAVRTALSEVFLSVGSNAGYRTERLISVVGVYG